MKHLKSWGKSMNMKYRVIITPTAFKEINKIYDYILEELYAEKVEKLFR